MGMKNNDDTDTREVPSPPSGERVRVRGRAPQYGKHRTRTPAARDFARQLRKKSTDAEKCLWRLLRDHRFAEFKFRRQYACGSYFLDFYCTVVKVAVELDGGGHGFPDQRARDEKRNQFFAQQGIKVLRFWNHQLRSELEAVRFEIWHALMERTGREDEIAGYLSKPAPSPQPSPPMGERESDPRPCDDMKPVLGKLGINATKKLPGEDFKRPWPPLIKMDAAVKAKVEKLFNQERQ